MKKDAKTRGKDILGELVAAAKTPELKTAITQLGADEELLEMLGDKTLKQDEFSRLANQLAAEKATYDQSFRTVQTHEQELNAWYEKNRRLVVLGEEVEKAGGLPALLASRGTRTGGDPEAEPEDEPTRRAAPAQPAIDTTKFLTKDEAARLMQQNNAQTSATVRQLNAITSKLSVSHYKEFGDLLDVQSLYDFCDQHQIPLHKGGYEAFVKDLREAAAEKALDKKLKEAEERGMKKGAELAARGAGNPFLVGNGDGGAPVVSSEPSVIDILAAKRAGKKASEAVAGDASSDVLAAVASYQEGVAKQSLNLRS